MDNILGSVREKKRKLMAAEATSENNPSPDYDQIVNLVAASLGHNISFPGDVVVQILCKLPVKSLIRFRAVCKPWNLLIKSPVFINKHLLRKNPQRGGFTLSEAKQDNYFPVDIEDIVGACNGIICLKTSCREKPLLLFNPSTREFSFVPLGLSSWDFYGFFYLSKTKEYQIISITPQRYMDNNNVDIRILTLGKTTSLRDVRDVNVPGWIRYTSRMTFGTTTIYFKRRSAASATTMAWLGKDYGINNEIVILYDVIQERFSKMDVPPSPSSSGRLFRSLSILQNSVIMFVGPRFRPTFFEIWMLIDDVSNGKGWMKYRKIGPLETRIHPSDVCWHDRWVLCSKNYLIYDSCSSSVFYYDLETDQVKDHCDLQTEQAEHYKVTDPPIMGFVNFVESLVSINSLVPCIDTDL